MIKINKFSVLKRMYKMAYENHWGHLASSTSALPIMIDIYENMTDRDYFVLSKGHAGMALYALLQELGYNPNTKYPYPVFQPTHIKVKECFACEHNNLVKDRIISQLQDTIKKLEEMK